MLMVNPVWEKEWGGKFQLYSEGKSEILEEYDYVPGRIVIFPSGVLSITPEVTSPFS